MRRSAVAAVLAVLVSTASLGAQEPGDRWWTLYLQRAWPKQTTANAQIEQINDLFGVDFDTWDDTTNLSLGTQLFWQVDRRWKVGVELDMSWGQIDGEATVATDFAGPANLKFVQKYALFANLMAAAHFLPCPSCERAVPFVLGAAGVGYEKDTTQLTLHNTFFYQRLEVENEGWFPVATVGVGVDIPLGPARAWFFELGTAYYWGRLDHMVPAEGSLAPAPKVRADTDSTGPNVWIGVARRF